MSVHEILARQLLDILYEVAKIGSIVSFVQSVNQKARTRRLAKADDFILAFRSTKSLPRKTKLFIKLWLLHLQSRDIALQNILFITSDLPRDFTDRALAGVSGRISVGKPRIDFPEPISKWTPQSLNSFIELLNLILEGGSSGIDWPVVLKEQVKETGKTFIKAQIFSSLLAVIFDLVFANQRGIMNRGRIEKIAKQMGVKNVSKLNKDQLRVAASKQLVALHRQTS